MNLVEPDTSGNDEAIDRALMAAVTTADRAAFSRLYSRYVGKISRYIRSLVRDDAATEELVVDTMTAVWEGATRYRADARVSTWILGIARHKALDVMRHRARKWVLVRIDDCAPLATSTATPLESVSDDERGSITRRVLASLSAEHREALHLAFYHDLTYGTIATRLGIPENTVKSRVYHAKLAMKRHVAALA